MNKLYKIPRYYEEGRYLLKDISISTEIPDSFITKDVFGFIVYI